MPKKEEEQQMQTERTLPNTVSEPKVDFASKMDFNVLEAVNAYVDSEEIQLPKGKKVIVYSRPPSKLEVIEEMEMLMKHSADLGIDQKEIGKETDLGAATKFRDSMLKKIREEGKSLRDIMISHVSFLIRVTIVIPIKEGSVITGYQSAFKSDAQVAQLPDPLVEKLYAIAERRRRESTSVSSDLSKK